MRLEDGILVHACAQGQLGRYEPHDICWIDEEVEYLVGNLPEG